MLPSLNRLIRSLAGALVGVLAGLGAIVLTTLGSGIVFDRVVIVSAVVTPAVIFGGIFYFRGVREAETPTQTPESPSING